MWWLMVWMLDPPAGVRDIDWEDYLDDLSMGFALGVVATVVLICLLYWYSARKLTFDDLQKPYWPMRFLWLSVLPGIALGIWAPILFDSYDALSGKEGAPYAAISTAFISVLLTALVALIVVISDRITPEMFKGRPWAAFTRIFRRKQ